jgi:hypothetical protein
MALFLLWDVVMQAMLKAPAERVSMHMWGHFAMIL